MLTKLQNCRYMQYLSALTIALGSAAVGMYSLWPSPALPILQSDDSPLGRPVSDEEGSWIVAFHKVGAIPSTLIAPYLMDKIGRKYSTLLAGCMLVIPWALIIFGTNIGLVYAARFISGVGTGIIVIGCTIYIGEIAENDIRGKLGTTFIALKLVGSLLVLCVGPYVSYKSLGYISASVPLVFISVYYFMPESPYYLVKVDKLAKAKKNLIILSSNSVDDKFIGNRMAEIQCCVREDMQNETTVWEFLSNQEYRNAIIIMFGIKTLQQFSGEAAIESYMQTIIGLSESSISEEISSIIFGVIQLPTVFASGFLVDKFGRKPLLIISTLGCSVALWGEGTFFYYQDVLGANVSPAAWVPTTGIALFLVMVPLGIVTLPYVLLGELFPTNIKAIAVSTMTLYGTVLSFLVTKFFKPLANVVGIHSVFWMFAAVCLFGAIFVLAMLPETKGKSFTEIQAVLNKVKEIEDIECKGATKGK